MTNFILSSLVVINTELRCCELKIFVVIKIYKYPYHAVKVTGALFHTQGGLNVTPEARVKNADGAAFPNLFAAGGAAVGVSGTGDSGYLSGNGLLSAVVLGFIAGRRAALDTKNGHS